VTVPTIEPASMDVRRTWAPPSSGPGAFVLLRKASIAVLAAIFGLVAGLNPLLALALVFGLALIALMLANVTVGVMVFTVVALLESLPTLSGAPSIAKSVGVFLLVGWLGAVAFHRVGNG